MAVRITLVCAGGMSTSLLVQKMKEAAKQKYPDQVIEIVASAESNFKKVVDQTDILLLGPQVSYLVDSIEKKYAAKEFPIVVIDSVDYGMINGERVLESALMSLNKG